MHRGLGGADGWLAGCGKSRLCQNKSKRVTNKRVEEQAKTIQKREGNQGKENESRKR